MLISFIIPIYNLPEWMLRECLESIRGLDLEESKYEIVVVDDGSQCSSEATIREVFPQAIVISKPNGGLSSARNVGIEVSKGDYIQFVDGDDMLLRSYRQVVRTLENNHLDLLMFSFSRKKETSSASLSNPIVVSTGAEYMASNNLRASAWSYIVSRDVIGTVRFPERMLHEDEFFTPQIVLASQRVAVLNTAAYYYRERTDSITRNNDKIHIQQRLDDTFSVISHLNDMTKNLESTPQAALRRRVAQLSMDYLYNTMLLMPNQLKKSSQRLRSIGLFPLPKGNYTIKYNLFRIVMGVALR